MNKKDLHVIVGLGATGLSCAKFLSQLQVPIAVTDTRLDPPYLQALRAINPEIHVALGGLDTKLLEQATRIILSPGIAKSQPVVLAQMKRGVPIVGDVELFAEQNRKPVVAITGTNAKSTVTTLVGKMAVASGIKTAVGGNLGIPVLDLLANEPESELFVLELSSFQLETTYNLKPIVATVLNITPDHLDRYKDFAEYQQTKLRIYNNCHTAICNLDDPLTEYHAADTKYYFSVKENRAKNFGLLNVNQGIYLGYEFDPLLATDDLPVKGRHYQANALASLALGHGAGLNQGAMLNVLRNFTGLPHRCQFVREHQEVKWYNDSKGTNVGATIAAIEGLASEQEGKLILIAGGLGKNADFSALLPVVAKYCRHVVLIGQAASDIERVVDGHVATTQAGSMQDAVVIANEVAEPRDSVLLSPACASFDMFENYAHRGDIFIKHVMAL